jgi:hypothetical protein
MWLAGNNWFLRSLGHWLAQLLSKGKPFPEFDGRDFNQTMHHRRHGQCRENTPENDQR